MGVITYRGDALPLFMLARGKTKRCEQQIKAAELNKVTHSGNGWVALEVMREYFEFLRQTVEKI
jgi:hypothetical protein